MYAVIAGRLVLQATETDHVSMVQLVKRCNKKYVSCKSFCFHRKKRKFSHNEDTKYLRVFHTFVKTVWGFKVDLLFAVWGYLIAG